MASDRPDGSRWFDNEVTVVVLLTVFFPLGLYALWKNSTFTPKTKWIVTGIVVVLALAIGTRREPRARWASADLPVSTGAEVAAPKSAEQERRKSESKQTQAALDAAKAEVNRVNRAKAKAATKAETNRANRAKAKAATKAAAKAEADRAKTKLLRDTYMALLRKSDIKIVRSGSVRILSDTLLELTLTVENIWHVRHKQVRLQDAQLLWKAWAGLASPNKPDSARIKIVDLGGNEVGGSRFLAGSLIWVQD